MSTLPTIETVAELDAFRAEPTLWRSSVEAIAHRHGIDPGALENLGGGNLVVGLGTTHVIKLAPAAFAREIDAEAAGLQHLSQRLPLETPRFHSAGRVDSWVYVIEERLSGRTLRSCWSNVPSDDRLAIMRRIGEWLAAFHAAGPPRDGVLADSWSDFIERQIALCRERQARWGVSPSIVDGLDRYVERSGVAASQSTALLHADLTDENLLLEQTGERWGVSAIIDFGDARPGDPIFDLITPALLIARGDHALLEALLDGYGIARSDRNEALRIRLMAYAILHPFNNLTRYTSWSSEPAETVEQLAEIMFPFQNTGVRRQESE